MSQNPYSASGMQPGSPIENFAQGFEPRTSVMAIVSLVLGILSLVMCCVGVGAIAGVPAAGFGIAAIIAINAKQGALSGRGMAVSGIVTGTIGLFGTILIWVGIASWVGNVQSLFRPVMTGIESADVRAVQGILAPEASAKLDEQRLLAFRKQYQDRVGAFQGLESNVLMFVTTAIKTYKGSDKVHELVEKYQRVPIVIDAKFANGPAQIWLVMPQNVQSKGKPDFFVDVMIVPPTGESISLLGLETAPGTQSPTPANPDPNATPPAAPAAPAPEQPATPPAGG